MANVVNMTIGDSIINSALRLYKVEIINRKNDGQWKREFIYAPNYEVAMQESRKIRDQFAANYEKGNKYFLFVKRHKK